MPIFCKEVRKSDMIRFKHNKYFAYNMVGEFRSARDWIHPTRVIESYELILVTEGTVYLQENGTEYELHSGDMILLEPNITHGGYRHSNSRTSFYWFHFFTNMPLPFKVSIGSDIYDVRYLLKKLLDMTNGGIRSENAADATAYLIFDELSRTDSKNNLPIQNVIEYIRINCLRDLSVSEIAAEFGYNPDYIGRLFKKYTKIGLKEYIATRRLTAAKELLLTTALPIKQIAAETGYDNENLFIKFFTYHEKITPTAFRNRYTNTHMNNK